MAAKRIAALLVILALASGAFDATAEISERKTALIQEMLELSGSGANATQVAQMFLAQIQYVYGSMVEQVVAEESDLSPREKEAVRQHLADFDWFAIAFSARFPERIDLDAVLEEVYVPLYDRYFEEEELAQIVAFYKTPAGQKTIDVMPRLMQEGLEATTPLIQPKVMELVGEILADRRSELPR